MDPIRAADALSSFADRLAGSDVERRAALQLRDRLAAAGRAAEIEPFRFHQRWALAQALAAGLAVVGSVLSVSSPALGTALVALATASSILEATGTVELIARLTGTRASQNVSSPPGAGGGGGGGGGATVAEGGGQAGARRPGLLVLAASYDAPRRSAFARVAERVRDPWLALGAALIATLLCGVLRMLGFEGSPLTAVQLVPTLLLLAAVPLLVDVELSPVGDGAAEAAGVGIAIDLAEQLDAELERLDVWLVLVGAGGALGAGMRAWRRRHRRALSGRPAATIEVGAPEPEDVERVSELYAEVAHGLDAELAS
jgi:hypothetical protein